MPAKKAKKTTPKPVKTTPTKSAGKAAKPAKKAEIKPVGTKELSRSGKYLYYFGDGKAEGSGKMRDLLGGKGSGLAEMTNIKIPVPPGFTITTETCHMYYENNMSLPDWFEKEIKEYMKGVEALMGSRFGDPKDSLLVSVRSGAKFSMPGRSLREVR